MGGPRACTGVVVMMEKVLNDMMMLTHPKNTVMDW